MSKRYDDEIEIFDINCKSKSSDYEEYTVDVADIYEEEQQEKKKKKKKKKKKTKRKIALLVGELLVISILVFTLVMLLVPNSKKWLLSTPIGKFLIKIVMSEEDYNNIFDENFDRDGDVNDGLDTDAMKDYYNIALIGVDTRNEQLESWANSDTIIICSINKKSGEVKLASVYRDTCMRVTKDNGEMTYNKVNSAYESKEGAQNLVKTLNTNLDLNISDYATINFSGLASIIDKLGGIDINLSKDEVYWINQYLTETRKITGMSAPDVYGSGMTHLTGLQAVAFCRIRYATFTDVDGQQYSNDYGRTARQRRVIQLIVEKAKEAGVSEVMDIADEIFHSKQKLIYTSIPYDEIIDLIPTLLDFSIVGTVGYPFTKESYNSAGGVSYPVCIAGLTYNNYKLHEFLFNNKNYSPSQTVKDLNDVLFSKFGCPEERLEGDENIKIK